MFSAISLFVLACAFAVNAQNTNSVCNSAQIGNIPTSHPVKLLPVVLRPKLADWLVTIPPVPECVNGESGVQAFICDTDVASTGYFSDINHLTVHRNGALVDYGTVTVTVYCNP